jgi:polysaccharide biosynthesis transport protein
MAASRRPPVDIRPVLRALRRRWAALVLLVVVCCSVGVAGVLGAGTHYRSTATVLLSSGRIGSIDDLASGSAYVVALAPSFTPLVKSAAVMSPVIAQLHLDTSPGQLATRIRVTLPLASGTISISATATDRQAAAALANAVADQFALQVPRLSPKLGTSPAVEATKIAPAFAPASLVGPKIAVGVVFGLLVALAIGSLMVAAYVANPLVDSRVIVARATDVPVVGAIPPQTRVRKGDASGSRVSEPYRALRTTLALALPELKSFLVVAATPGDGASQVSVQLAVSAAEASRRVLLVDTDLRRPQVRTLLELDEAAGLSAILTEAVSPAAVIRSCSVDGLDVLTTGSTLQRTGRLASRPMNRFLVAARQRYDVVVVDAPSLGSSNDALALATRVDGIIVVVNTKRTRQRQLSATIRRLGLAGGTVVGVVLNRAPQQERLRKPGTREYRNLDLPARLNTVVDIRRSRAGA